MVARIPLNQFAPLSVIHLHKPAPQYTWRPTRPRPRILAKDHAAWQFYSIKTNINIPNKKTFLKNRIHHLYYYVPYNHLE